MSRHWLRNYYNSSRQLHYNTETGAFEKHRAADMDAADLTPRPGAFVQKEGEILGLSPSVNGPLFFRGQERTVLAAGQASATLTDDGGLKVFSLSINGTEVVRFIFTPDPIEEFDVFTGESDEFFDWLTHLLPAPHFYPLFTI